MADPVKQQQAVPEAPSSTVTVVSADTQDGEVPTLRLRLKKPKSDKKVKWTTETVDNEDMNKKKSKCCCIFNKPRKFDESSSSEDSDDECDHCHGHVEKKKHKKGSTIDSNLIPSENHTETLLDPNPNSEPPSSD